MKIGVVQFPGTNCDRDVAQWLSDQGHKPTLLWHEDLFSSQDVEGLVIPGGFSFGDYLRSGAVAARSRVMESVKEVADLGKPVLGICNGFQILCEAGLLPGALIPNVSGLFVDDWVELESPMDKKLIKLPVAHGDGRYFIHEDERKKLWDHNQVWWQYKNFSNGSLDQIAGVINQAGNVKGLMPHPERAYRDWMGGMDGWKFWI